MKPAAFTYHRARDIDGAVELLTELGDDAKIIAGGQSLVPMMNFRLARPTHLVDITGLPGLATIGTDREGLHIGPLTTHRAVETAPVTTLGTDYAVLREAMAWVGHLPIRTLGTVGGSLAHGDATAEWCLLAVLLDARVVARGPSGAERTIDAKDLFLGYYMTTLAPDELIVDVVFPTPAPHSALTEFAERAGDFAAVAAGVSLDLAMDGTVSGGRVALGGVAPAPVRVPEAEAVLQDGGPAGPELFAACAEAAAAVIDPPSDADGSSDYRRVLARTLIVRACEEAVAR